MARVACASCRTVVDAEGAEHGKAEPFEAASTRLEIGTRVVIPYRVTPSRDEPVRQDLAAKIVGGVQWRHPLGGVWTEWSLALERELPALSGVAGPLTVAWLAEYQGNLAVLFARSAAAMQRFGSSNAATPGQRYQTTWGLLECVDRGLARVIAIEGQIADEVAADDEREFVDFSGPPDRLATLSFEGVPDARGRRRQRFHYGHEVTPALLGLGVKAAPSSELTCPRCSRIVRRQLVGMALVVCSGCRTGLAMRGGELEVYFRPASIAMAIEVPIGTRATLSEAFLRSASIGPIPSEVPAWPSRVDVRVSGYLVRKVVVDGETFHYAEYTLEAANGGFYWLVITDGEWYLARTLNTSLVEESGGSVTLGGVRFALKEANLATVVQVEGEHDYLVKPGDEAQVADYAFGARLVSKEETVDEVLWTECIRVPSDAVAQAFGVRLRQSRSASQGGAGDDDEDESSSGDELTSNPMFWLGLLALLFIIIVLAMDGECGGGGGSFGFGK